MYKERAYRLVVFVVRCSRRFHPVGLRLELWLFPQPVPLAGRETPHYFFATANTAGDSGVAWVSSRYGASVEWKEDQREKGQKRRNGGWLLVLVERWSDLGWNPGRNGQAGHKCT